MAAIGQALTWFFTLLLRPFENGQAFAGIIFVSLVTGAVMLVLFKVTSNQQAMREVKSRISAHFLEMRLYKDDFRTVAGSQGRVLMANLRYMRLALLPAVVLIVPVVLIMIQLNLRYAYMGLAPGSTAMVKVKVAEGGDVLAEHLMLIPGEGVEKASPAVRIKHLGEVDWKVRLVEPGVHEMRLSSTSGEMAVPVFGGKRLIPRYTVFRKASFLEGLLNPGAPGIPSAMGLESIQVTYPPMVFDFGLFELSWLWTFLIVSMAFGFVLKFIFKVE